jgi:hypothetical protein
MDDQDQDHQAVAEDGADFQVAEAVGQLLFQPQAVEQGLEQYQAGERCQLLVFKLDFGKAVCFTVNSRSATLHVDGLLWFYWLVRTSNVTKAGPFFIGFDGDIPLICRLFWISPEVKPSDMRKVCDSGFV